MGPWPAKGDISSSAATTGNPSLQQVPDLGSLWRRTSMYLQARGSLSTIWPRSWERLSSFGVSSGHSTPVGRHVQVMADFSLNQLLN